MAQPPIGPDWASVDGNNTPNLIAAKQAGARFAIPRAIYGRPADGQSPVYIDPVWARDKDRIVAAGLRRSAFLFVCYPKEGLFTPEPEVQADAFIKYVQLTSYHDYVPFFDVEEQSDILSHDEMYDWTLRVAQRLRDHYGAWPGMYTAAHIWAEYFGNHAPGKLINCPLWLAKPWPLPEDSPVRLDGMPTYSPITIPQWGNQWFGYQYQGDAIGWPGFNKTVDATRWRVFGKGATGDHVKWTQQRLGITADGVFGLDTEAAVKALQALYGLTPDGFVGADTFAPLCWLGPAPA